MTNQLAVILRNQRINADHHGDADRIAEYEARQHTTPASTSPLEPE